MDTITKQVKVQPQVKPGVWPGTNQKVVVAGAKTGRPKKGVRHVFQRTFFKSPDKFVLLPAFLKMIERINEFYFERVKSTINGRRLAAAGFVPGEIQKALQSVDFGLAWEVLSSQDSILHDRGFSGFISQALPKGYEKQRQKFLHEYLSGYLSDNLDMRSSITNLLGKEPVFSKKRRTDFVLYVRDLFFESNPIPFNKMLTFGADIIGNDFLYKLFDKKVERVIDFRKEKFSAPDFGDFLSKAIDTIITSPYGWMLVEDKKDESVLEILSGFIHLRSITENRELTVIFNEFVKSERTWADKLIFFEKIVRANGLSYVRQETFEKNIIGDHIKNMSKKGNWTERQLWEATNTLSEEQKAGLVWKLTENLGQGGIYPYIANLERKTNKSSKIEEKELQLLKRVRRRENPLNPLVSLGIARTVGYEIEYPRSPKNIAGLNNFLSDLGFKQGVVHDGSCLETSPGPFYDPLTANMVFEKYVDSGILNFHGTEGAMTFHFNVDVLCDGLIPLVRAMHLTGAGFDQTKFFFWDDLRIFRNNNGYGDYTECKTFDAISPYEFKWNMRCASYLAWALGASQDKCHRNSWGIQLSNIWKNYLSEINKGLKSQGSSDYLYEGRNKEIGTPISCIGKVTYQLNCIFSQESARFGGLNEIDSSANEKIFPIKIDDKVWPNVAAFARDVTEQAVQKIENIVDFIENEAIEDVRKIEKLSGSSRTMAIGNFLTQYNYVGGLETYTKVRDLLLKNL